MPASGNNIDIFSSMGNNDIANVFNNSIQTMSTQHKTLTISHVKGEHLKNI